jgi:ribosomal-protein-alanine N-acetyltransferase
VFLRVPVLDDYPAWRALREESRDFLTPWEPSWPLDGLTKAAFRRRLRYYALDRRQGVGLVFFIFRQQDKALLGSISLSHLRRGVCQTADLGYWIGERHANRGYGGEALAAVLAYSFTQLGLNRLEAATLPENGPSQRLLRKFEFIEEGFARKYLKINGKWADHVLYGLVQEDYLAARAATKAAVNPRAAPDGKAPTGAPAGPGRRSLGVARGGAEA